MPKQIRVLVVFEDVRYDGKVMSQGQKFGAVTTVDFGPVERIAEKLGECVSNHILTTFPAFLEDPK